MRLDAWLKTQKHGALTRMMFATKISYATLQRLKFNKAPARYENAKAIETYTKATSEETGVEGFVTVAELCELPAPEKKASRKHRKSRKSSTTTSFASPKLAATRT